MKKFEDLYNDENIIYEHPQIPYHELKMMVAKGSARRSFSQQSEILKAYSALGKFVYVLTMLLAVSCIISFVVLAVHKSIYGAMMSFFAFPLVPSFSAMIPQKMLLRRNDDGEIEEDQMPEILKGKFTAEKIIAACCIGIMTFMTLDHLNIINVNWVAVLVAVMLAVVVAAECMVVASIVSDARMQKKCTEPVTARLVGLKLELKSYSSDGTGAGGGTYLAAKKIIEYSYYGEEIRTICGGETQYSGSEPIGSEFEVFVNPEKPSEAVTKGDVNVKKKVAGYAAAIAFIGIFVVMLAGVLIYICTSENIDSSFSKGSNIENGRKVLTDGDIKTICAQNGTDSEEFESVVVYERVITDLEYDENNILILCFDDHKEELTQKVRMSKSDDKFSYSVGDTVYWINTEKGVVVYNTKLYIYKGKHEESQMSD